MFWGPEGRPSFIARARKALVAGVAAGVTAYSTAAAAGSINRNAWITIVGSVVVVTVITWLTPNAPTTTGSGASS